MRPEERKQSYLAGRTAARQGKEMNPNGCTTLNSLRRHRDVTVHNLALLQAWLNGYVETTAGQRVTA